MNKFELYKNSFSRSLGRSLNLLLEISHPDFEQKYYFVNDTRKILVDDKEYQPCPFDIVLPAQTETQGTQLVISNIQNIAANELKKTINSNENIEIIIYIANIESDTADKNLIGVFELQDAAITPEAVSGTINIRHCLEVNLGNLRYNRQLFTNLYL